MTATDSSTGSGQTPIDDAPGALATRRAAREFLAAFEPYNRIEPALLDQALAGAHLAYHPAGHTLISPDDGPPAHFSVVQQGLIGGHGADDEIVFESGPGETLLSAALRENRATRTRHVAERDSFVIDIPAAGFRLLHEQAEPFREFCRRRAGALLHQSHECWRGEAAADLQADVSLDTPLQQLIGRPPVTGEPDLSVREAVRRMHADEVGSIVVVDGNRQPTGIFTLRDLRRLVATRADGLEAPLSAVMTPNPLLLDAGESAFEATLLMVEHRIGHLVVTRGGALAGVISERDLFALRRVNLVHLSRGIDRCRTLDGLRARRREMRELIRAMLAFGASATQLTGLITRLNDAAVERAISICREAWPEPVPDFTWLSFGSEARGEQTLATDQDNGLLFEAAPGDTEAVRTRLLPLAQQINRALDQIGFDLCRGNIMAGNPALCLSRAEWQARFEGIIRSTTPAHLLDATIYLDCRALAGDVDAVERLRAMVLDRAANNSIFRHALAHHALGNRLPLGLVRDFVTERGEEGRRLDLKKSALQPFIGATRVLALTHRVAANNTQERLAALAATKAIRRRDAQAWQEAFSFVQLLRLRHNQAQLAADEPLSNRIDPYRLSLLDQRVLKESLRQARRLQTRLKLDYP
ncbi:DUF294 nucleotidyltransferase-like domain-containing protein [Salinisphaera sp. P385]|uniref:DUF294 nucleotidyltransferase-like domain-containing protein n=1 Tax=Spectribacter acetivorans TaxID=3075603 RepID=A0ABU3B933_9GAMM|nr:DUF294 nucleotidyltransferase-like domain-containing protein [Salinisphaera sp. P385]MDT0618983.1 DUF294 nucleotidyltransferase-like domain-containing protein [Salinisphaera sp. P385]